MRQTKLDYFLTGETSIINPPSFISKSQIRERLKVMRGTHSPKTAQAIIDGKRFYYNFIRPHMSLKGMTPAQIANLPIPEIDDNPWLSYLKSALDQ